MADIELVIKIDKEEYKNIKACTSFMPWTEYLIKKGTPLNEVLDKIKAEIDIARFIDKDTKLCKNANASGLEVALQIIDKYRGEVDCRDCKAEYECYECKKYEESEDKE